MRTPVAVVVTAPPAHAGRTVVVLPLADIGPDAGTAYFSGGPSAIDESVRLAPAGPIFRWGWGTTTPCWDAATPPRARPTG